MFAFVLVCGGVLYLPIIKKEKNKFSIPYVSGQFIIPLLNLLFILLFKERLQSALMNIGAEDHQEILFIIFVFLSVIISILTFLRKYSLIPVLGVLFCLYLMIEIPAKSWMVFFIWMAIGLTIYFLYGRKKSLLQA